MTRLRHANPPRDLSNVLLPEPRKKKLTARQKKRQQKRRLQSGRDSRPMLTREERQARKDLAEATYMANNPPVLIKASEKKAKRKR
jgi:hypothetical protein